MYQQTQSTNEMAHLGDLGDVLGGGVWRWCASIWIFQMFQRWGLKDSRHRPTVHCLRLRRKGQEVKVEDSADHLHVPQIHNLFRSVVIFVLHLSCKQKRSWNILSSRIKNFSKSSFEGLHVCSFGNMDISNFFG